MQTNDTYNRGGMIAFVFSMVFSLVFFFYVALMNKGIDLKEVPQEALTGGNGPSAEGSTAAVAAVDVSKIEKPWETNDDMIAHGAKVYKANCTACHGEKGAGDGPAGQALVPPPRNLIEGKWKKGGDSISLYNTLKVGIPGTSMAGFGHLPPTDRWALVQFIHSITQDKVADDAAKLEAFAKSAE